MSRDLRELLHDTAEPPTRPVEATRIIDEAERRTTRHRVGMALAAAAVILAGFVVLPQLAGGDWAPRIGDVDPAGPTAGERTVFASGQIPSGEWTASVWLEQPRDSYTICIEVRHGTAQDLGCRPPIDPGEIMAVGPGGWIGDEEHNKRPVPAVYGQVAATVAQVVVGLDDGTQVILRPHLIDTLDVAVVGHAFPADRYPIEVRAVTENGDVLQRDWIRPEGAGEGPSEGTERGVTSLSGRKAWVLTASPSTLWISAPSCHGNPELVRVEEDEESVRVEVVTTRVVGGGPALMCADIVTVELDEPFGDRELVDITSGAVLEVLPYGPTATPTRP